MKSNFRLFRLALIAWMVSLAAQAQEDVTAMYLINPGFEEGPSFFHDSSVVVHGWNISKANLLCSFLNQNDGVVPPQGKNVFGVWAPGTVGDYELSQTVKGLPAGTYTVSSVMTTFKLEYTTQRMFVSTPSAGTKAMYYEAGALDTVAGEKAYFAGFPDDGNGNGPYRPMILKIKVAAGESLVFGVRTNGTKSVLCPVLKTQSKDGYFKVDNFKLNFIPDDVAYTKTLIQAQLNLVNAFPKDTIPQSYVAHMAAKVAWVNAEIATQTNMDSLECCLTNVTEFLGTLGIVKSKFMLLKERIGYFNTLASEYDLPNSTNLPGKIQAYAVFNHALDVCASDKILSREFDQVYAQLNTIIFEIFYYGLQNQALTATVSTSSLGSKLLAVNDGFEPSSSSDTLHTVYEIENGSNGKTNWVQYEWPNFSIFTSAYVYWFADSGRVAPPVAATVEYWNDNQWNAAGAIGTALNKWNVLNLGTLSTRKVRLSFQGLTSTGICEFGAVGYKDRDFDYLAAMIRRLLTSINALPQDSLPKGFTPLIATYKLQCDSIFTHRMLYVNSNTFLNSFSDFHDSLHNAHIAFHHLAFWMDASSSLLAKTNYPNKTLLQNAYNDALSVVNASSSLLADFNASIFALQSAVDSYTATGLHSEVEERISIYPNPVKDNLTIDFGSLTNGSARITNVLGQTVYSSKFNDQKMDINTTRFATGGLFFVQIFDPQNTLILTKKILKK